MDTSTLYQFVLKIRNERPIVWTISGEQVMIIFKTPVILALIVYKCLQLKTTKIFIIE